MRVRLTRKLAQVIDGIDLSGSRVGDVLELTDSEAELLVAEGWARHMKSGVVAADDAERRRRERRERIRTHIDDPAADVQGLRRVEDRIREELRDDRARIIQSITHSIEAADDPQNRKR